MSETAQLRQPMTAGKTISWNGISVSVPVDWHIARLDLDGMVLKRDGRATLSAGWRRSAKGYRPERDLQRVEQDLDVKIDRRDGTVESRLWSDAVLRHEKRGITVAELSWDSEGDGGIGALVHNPKSGLTMILLFHLGPGCAERDAAKVLYSVRDHWGGESLPLAIHDFRARVTPEYRMTAYEVDDAVRRIRLRRRGGGDSPEYRGETVLTLEHWPDAREMLGERSLEQWLTQTHRSLLPGKPLAVEPLRVSWSGPAPVSLWARFLFRVEHCRGRVWLDRKRNALFLVDGRGSWPVSKTEMADLCDFFEGN